MRASSTIPDSDSIETWPGEYRSPICPDQVSNQVSAMELSNHMNIIEHIRLALEVPERAGDRGAGSYHLELAPTFWSAMSFDREFEQAIHRKLVVQKKGC
jgi:hypothetical protein